MTNRKPEDIDISGFEEFDIPAEGDQVQGDFSGGDIELEFEVDEDTDDLDGMATVSDVQEMGAGPETVEYSEPLVAVDAAPAKEKEKRKKPKKIKPVRKSGVHAADCAAGDPDYVAIGSGCFARSVFGSECALRDGLSEAGTVSQPGDEARNEGAWRDQG